MILAGASCYRNCNQTQWWVWDITMEDPRKPSEEREEKPISKWGGRYNRIHWLGPEKKTLKSGEDANPPPPRKKISLKYAMNISPVYAHLVKSSKLPFKVSKSVTSKPLETFGTDAKNSCPRDSFFWNQWTLDFSGWQFISQQKLENLSVWKKPRSCGPKALNRFSWKQKKLLKTHENRLITSAFPLFYSANMKCGARLPCLVVILSPVPLTWWLETENSPFYTAVTY